MIKIGFFSCYSKESPIELINKFTWNLDYKYKNIEIVKLEDNPDFVVTSSYIPSFINPKKCIYICSENSKYREIFWKNGSINKKELFHVFDNHWLDFHFMSINQPLKYLYEFRNDKNSNNYKYKLVSFLSNKINIHFPLYEKRLKFSINYLDNLEYYNCWCRKFNFTNKDSENGFDIQKMNFYASRQLGMKNYNSELWIKDNILENSLYCFECENYVENGYITEKILGPLFYNCFVFYSGYCSNIEHIINPLCYEKISFDNMNSDFIKIKNLIESKLYDDRKDIIFEEKRKLLIKFNLLENLNNLMEIKL